MLGALVRTGRFLARHPLTRDHTGRAFARYLSWQVRSRLHDELIVPWVEGTRLAVRRGMTGATGNIYTGLHEFPDMAFLLHFLRAGDLFIDVGANVGSYTVLASGVRRARTVAFEPDPDAASALRRNVQINELEDLVFIHEAAVGSAPGEAVFTIGLDATNHVISDREEGPTRAVRMDALDHVLADQTPLMIKIDVEGYEPYALAGASALLASPALEVVLTEDRSPPVLDLLRKTAFKQYGYDPFSRTLTTDAYETGNALFVRTAAFVQRRLVEAPLVRIFETAF